MPIGSTNVYNPGDLILSTVSGSGTSFIETKIIAATSSFILFNSSGTLTSASLNSIVAVTSSYVSGSTSIITNLTASNISASGTSSFGYVGIGTSSPSTKLHVRLDNAGETTLALFENRLTDFASAAAGQIVVGARGYNHTVLRQNPDLGTTPSIGSSLDTVLANTCALGSGFGNLILATQSTASLIIDYSGNVGIGTSSPSYKLDIAGGIKIGGEETLPFAIGSMYLSYNSAINRIYYGDGTGYDLRFSKRGAGATTDFVTFKDTGNVGIGTTSPAYKLDVNGTIALSGFPFADKSGNYNRIYEPAGNVAIYLGNASDQGNYYDNTTHYFRNRGGASNYVIINNYGNVGIGTSSPTAKLHIYNGSSHFEATSNGNAAIVAGLYALQIGPLHDRDSTAGSYYGGIAFNHLLNYNGVSTYNGAPQAWIGTRLQDTAGSERDYLVFATKPGTGTSGTGNDIPIERVCIDRDGLVGIGTTVPTARLHVSGSTIITGSLNVSANITCLSLTETSTEAVKYNILPLPSQLDNVLKLKPVSFNYKANDKHSIGLIAEEVAKIYPEFTSDNNDSISYGKITSVLIQSIKELKTIIDNQQKQIENLIDKLK